MSLFMIIHSTVWLEKTNKNFRETAKLEEDLTFFGFNKYSYSVSSLHITALVLFAVEYE